jgi:predicted N-acetyltransferase YhbS
MENLPPVNSRIEYIPDAAVDALLDEQLRALLSTCFTGEHNARFKTQRFYSEMPQHRFLVREPGRVAAHAAFHYKMIGTPAGEFRIAAVAEVAVHPDYRGRGLVKELMAAGHEFCVGLGCQFGFLFGSHLVYSSSGYLPVTNPLRYFDPVRGEWLVRSVGAAMVKPLGATPWPEGEVDLRGPMF